MKFLLINPYACDFACHDYWLKPLGLLYISSILKKEGHQVQFIDCLHRRSGAEEYGKGKLPCRERKKPEILKNYKRKYSNYGIYGEKLYNILKSCERPDIVLLSTSMTYWYPAAGEVAEMIRHIFPDATIIAGGTYVTLCPEHAKKNLDADYFFSGASLKQLFSFINEDYIEFPRWPLPDYSHYFSLDYAVIRTSAGCGRGCRYCGINKIWQDYFKRRPEKIKSELNYYTSRGIRDIVFYDDALVENDFLWEYLDSAPKELRFHTPNGINVKKIDKPAGEMMKKANFIYPTLAVDKIGRSGAGKSTKSSVEKAVENLYSAGYRKGEVCAYLILGLPGQKLSEVTGAARFLSGLGLKVLLAEYAVVPGSGYDNLIDDEILKEPLLHNNSIFPCVQEDMEEVFKIKRAVAELNRGL